MAGTRAPAIRRTAIKKRVFTAASLVPAVCITAFPFAAGLFYSLKAGGAYRALFASPFFTNSFVFSCAVAGFTGCAAMVVGIFFAFVFCGKANPPGLLAKAFVVMPYLAAASITAGVLGDSGVIAHIIKLFYPSLRALGIRYHPLGLGVVSACLYKQIPFVFLCLSVFFKDLRKQFIDETRVLGAGQGTVFFKIVLPGAIRPVVGIWIIIFQFTLFNYEAFAFLGPSSPKGLGELLAMYYYSANESDKILAMTLCSLEFSFSFVSAWVLGSVMLRRGGE
jgi:ABC-type spermidine/putrescine transport system permease subunit I